MNRAAATIVNALWWAGAMFGLLGGAFVVGVYLHGLVT